MTQKDLSVLAGVGRPWVSELENGKRTAELGKVLAVLSALDLAIAIVPLAKEPVPGIDLGRIIDGAL